MKVLFCDSFHQEPPDGSVYNTWSAIEFPVPVVLEQIRVLPRGVCVHEQLRADGQCGKTSPGQFRIDFFACDEKNDKASTFENLCALEFSEVGNTAALPRLPFVTTKLLCSGRYSVVTIAVFGAEASDSDAIRQIHQRRRETTTTGQGLLPTPPEAFRNKVDETQLAQFSGQPLHQIQPPISTAVNFPGQSFPGHNPSYGFRNNEQSSYQSNRYDSRGHHERSSGQHRQNRPRDGFHGKAPLLPTPAAVNKDQGMHQQHHSDAYQYNRYQQHGPDGNYQAKDGGWNNDNSFPVDKIDIKAEQFSETKEQDENDSWDAAEYEEISDEELDEEAAANMEAMVAEDMLLPSSMMSFNPFHMEVYPLTYFNAPDMTEFELIRNKMQDQQDGGPRKKAKTENAEPVKLKKLIEESLNLCPVKLEAKSERHSKQKLTTICVGKEKLWVNHLEKMVPLISKGLPYLEVKSDLDYAFVLSTWAVFALQLDGQIAEFIGLNIRAMKVGLSLAQELCHTSADIVEHFTTVNLTESLFDILNANHVASSMKILAIHVLDALTNWPMQLHSFMYGENDEVQLSNRSRKEIKAPTGYAQIINLCLKSQTARVSSALNQLVQKIHIYECMREIQSSVQSLVLEKIPDEYAYVSEDEESQGDEDEDYSNNCEDMDADGAATIEHDEGEEETVMETTLSEQRNIEVSLMQNEGKRRVIPTQTSIHTSHENHNEEDASYRVENNDNSVISMESVFSLSDVMIDDKDICKIAECVNEVTNAFAHPQETIGQFSLKHFPLSKQYLTRSDDFNKTKANNTLYRMTEESGLLPSIQALLTLPIVSGHRDIFESCSSLLNQLMTTKSGLIYLLVQSDSVLHIINHLMKSSPALDIETPGTAGYLGAKLSFHLQVLQSLDHIWSLIDADSLEEEVEEDLVHDLKTLFSLTYPQFGKRFVSDILGTDNLLSSIIACLWFPAKLSDPDPVIEKNEEEDKKSTTTDDKSEDGDVDKVEKKSQAIQHKTAINGYAASLLLFMLESSDNASYIYCHLADLTRACLSEFHLTSKSEEFKKHLSPLDKNLKGDNSDIVKLISFVKEKTSLLEWSSLTIDGPGITTALRLLYHLCIKDNGDNADAELRLRVLELFSNDAFSVLLTLGEQLHKALHYFCHGIRPMAAGLVASTHSLIISICQCILLLLRLMLKQVLEFSIDNNNIDDVHLTQIVISLYSDLYILLRPVDTSQLHSITGKVVAVLSSFFTHVSPSDKPNLIISEMIKHAESQCDNFVPTLLLLSQLLPMPLPIVTPDQPPISSQSGALASCKLWGAIIAPHVEKLTSFLLPLSSSISRPVLDVVVILMQQIIDLSPNLALAVVKKYIEDTSPLLVNTVLGTKDEDGESKEETDEEQKELLMLSAEQITAIVTFSEILTLPAAKAAIINALSNEGEGVMDLWTYAAHSHTPDEDVAAALLLASVLVDTDISLVPADDNLASLSNAFPPTAHLKSIVDLAMEKIDCASAQVSTRVFLVLGLLQSNRFSIPYVRRALKSDREPLYRGLEKIVESFDDSNLHWFDAVYNFIEFLLLLTDASLDLHVGRKDLSLALNYSQLKSLLRWEKGRDDHPLEVLREKLNKVFSDDLNVNYDVDYILNKLSSVVQSLNAAGGKEKVPGLDREELPTPVALVDLFSDRPVYVIGCDDSNLYTRLSVTAPLPVINGSIEGEDQRMVQCDLIATAEKFCPGYDLADELNKLAKAIDVQHVAEETEAMEKRRQKMETYSARLGKSLTFMKRSHGLLIAQQRTGRGRGRGRGNPSHRPFDLFRHRKQNTSRPPSMHVDDFVAADEEEEQKMEGDESSGSFFKSPLSIQTRHPASNPLFKPREFTPRGGRGGRISRNTGGYRGRGSFSYQGNNITPLNKFRPRPSSAGSRGGHIQSRYRTNSSSRMGARLSFSPHEGFKTNKPEQGSWRGSSRDYSYHNRGGKPSRPPNRGGFAFGQSNNRWGTSSFQRRGRAYNKPRGKHIRSTTR